MKISVIMIDGGFRERAFSARSFCRQDFSEDDYEVLWIEFYDRVHPDVLAEERVRAVTLDNPPDVTYHSSKCFNRGIREASGEILVIPDADQIARPDFLSRTWELHADYNRLALYSYRFNEPGPGVLESHELPELETKCICTNPRNHGGCLSVRKKWLLEINGYEEHPVFSGGFHANGYDVFTRLSLLGLAVQWEPTLPLYHPWHPFTLVNSDRYNEQFALADWRLKERDYRTFRGIDPGRNRSTSEFPEAHLQRINSAGTPPSLFRRLKDKASRSCGRLLGSRSESAFSHS